MAMISRLQEEKASIEMDARQYHRLIEGKSAYEAEEMNILKEMLVCTEREKHFLEKELEVYRQMTYLENEESAVDSGNVVDALRRDIHALFGFGSVDTKQMGKKGEKQFRWTKPMEYLMLEILADEVKQGNKSTTQFTELSFNRVAEAINQRFEVECSPKHVENHLKTIRNTWNTVQTLLNKSGLGWNDNYKMTTASPSVYAAHIQDHPAHEKFINKNMFEKMSLVCGNDQARGDCAKSFDHISLDSCSEKGNNDDIQGPSKEKEVEYVVSETPQVKISRKRSRSDMQDMFVDVSSKLGEVVSAISRIADTKLDVKKLHKEVMSTEGYEEAFLSQVVDFLVEREPLARAFMEKSPAFCKLWLEKNKARIL